MSLLGELKRRNVFRVAVAYVIVSWIILQAVDLVFPALLLPDWTATFVLVLLLIGFPLAMLFAWAFELTPDGLKRSNEVEADASITSDTGRRLEILTLVALVGLIGVTVWQSLPGPPVTAPAPVVDALPPAPANTVDPRRSIAVLPFVNMSGDASQDYFSDGLSEELLNVLMRVEGISLASRTSAFAFKGTKASIPEIAEALNVAHILEGSVRRSGDRLRITAQLIDTATDTHLWSETYDREHTEIFAIQDEIAGAIVAALSAQLGLDNVSVSVAAATTDLSAYDLYLEARELFIGRRELARAAALMRQALDRDPGFARGWEGLAAILSVSLDWGVPNTGERHFYDMAIEAAEQAIALDNTLSLAHATRAIILWQRPLDPDFEAGLAAMDRAVALNPRDPTINLWRGLFDYDLGFYERGLAWVNKCLALDPAYDNCRANRMVGYMMLGRYEEAIRDLEITVRHNFADSYFVAMMVGLVAKGHDLAALYLADLTTGHSGAPIADWVAAVKDPEADHAAALARTRRWAEDAGIDMTTQDKQMILAFLGDFSFLTDTTPRYEIFTPGMPVAFRRDPRFDDYLIARNIAAYWQAHGPPPQCRADAARKSGFACD